MVGNLTFNQVKWILKQCNRNKCDLPVATMTEDNALLVAEIFINSSKKSQVKALYELNIS